MHENLKMELGRWTLFLPVQIFCYGLDDYGQQGSLLKK